MVGSTDYRAPPLSWAKVDGLADKLRANLQLARVPYLPIVEIMEKICYERLELFEFQVRDRSEMGSDEGLTCPCGEFIRIRSDVYEGACDGSVRPRFTLSHELGHFFLHTNVPLARVASSEQLPAYRSAETQANRFASSFLMPSALIDPTMSIEDVMGRFGVSRPAANFRLNDLFKGRRP